MSWIPLLHHKSRERKEKRQANMVQETGALTRQLQKDKDNRKAE